MNIQSIKLEDLDALALGANVLGSGGGGDPAYDLLIAKEQIEIYGPATVIQIENLSEDALIMPVGYMGAPLVSLEMLPSGNEFPLLIDLVENHFGKKVTAILPFEIGGSNAFAPFAVASRLKIPVVDGDTFGRAFPQMHMSHCTLANLPCNPAFIADKVGSSAIVKTLLPNEMENHLRALTSVMGANTAVCVYPMSGLAAKKAVVQGTLSKALTWGKDLERIHKGQQCSTFELMDNWGGKVLFEGVIHEIETAFENSFLIGKVVISNKNDEVVIHYQNEFLAVQLNGTYVATTPDIIVILDADSYQAIPVERLQYGLKVTVCILSAPDSLKSAQGLHLTGPQAFGFETNYISFNEVLCTH